MKNHRTILLIILLLALPAFSACADKDDGRDINLTQAEKAWIKEHPSVRVANEMDWPPFDYNELGTPKGLAIDHIKLLARKVGLKLQFVSGYTWSELLDLFRQKQIDVMPGLYKNPQREEYTLYTKPYYRGGLGIFTNIEDKNWDGKLIGKRVGIQKAHGGLNIIDEQFPGIKLIEIPSILELAKELSKKKLDAIIASPLVVYFHAKMNQINNVQLSDYIDMSEKEQLKASLHVGVRKDWPVLHAILQKAMQNTSKQEVDDLEGAWTKWTDIPLVERIDWVLVGQIVGVALLLVLFLVWHNRTLKSTVRRRTQELQDLTNNLEALVEKRTADLKRLSGLLPICASCKKIRDDKGYWQQVDTYVGEHSEAEFSHSICPECMKDLYPEVAAKVLSDKNKQDYEK